MSRLNRPEVMGAFLGVLVTGCSSQGPAVPVEIRPTPAKVEIDLQGVTQHKYRTTGEYDAPGFPNVTWSEEQETRNPYSPDCAKEILIDTRTGQVIGREHFWKRIPGVSQPTVVAKLKPNTCKPDKIGSLWRSNLLVRALNSFHA